MALVDLGPLAPPELATRLNTDRSHVSTYVESLQPSGSIERHPGTSDRRGIIVAITGTGTDVAHDIAAASPEAALKLLSEPAEDERVESCLLRKVLLSADGRPGAPAGSTRPASC